MVNAGEATVVELAVGSSRVIKAVVDATGEVTKVSVETASNVVGHVAEGVSNAVAPVTKRGAAVLKAKKEDQEE
jgi:hypothetical protein